MFIQVLTAFVYTSNILHFVEYSVIPHQVQLPIHNSYNEIDCMGTTTLLDIAWNGRCVSFVIDIYFDDLCTPKINVWRMKYYAWVTRYISYRVCRPQNATNSSLFKYTTSHHSQYSQFSFVWLLNNL